MRPQRHGSTESRGLNAMCNLGIHENQPVSVFYLLLTIRAPLRGEGGCDSESIIGDGK